LQTWHPPTFANESVLPIASSARDEDYEFVTFIVFMWSPQQELQKMYPGTTSVMFLGNRRNKRTSARTLEESLIFPVVVADFKRTGDW
jgi:hypothetical protein